MAEPAERTKAKHIRDVMDRSGIPKLQSKLRKVTGLNGSTISNIYQLKQEPNDLTYKAILVGIERVASLQRKETLDFLRADIGRGRPYERYDVDASRADPHAIGHTIKVRTNTPAGEPVEYYDNIYADKYLPSSIVPHPEWGLAAMAVDGESIFASRAGSGRVAGCVSAAMQASNKRGITSIRCRSFSNRFRASLVPPMRPPSASGSRNSRA